jgi:surface protein
MEIDNETIRIAVNLYARNETEGEEKYGHINTWNVSNVTDMHGLFYEAKSFNQPLNNWDVSNVTDMRGMFWSASSFNQPLDNWDVSNVIDMFYMFGFAKIFNKPLNTWNVSKVTDMLGMFKNTTIDEMLENHNLTNENYFDNKVYHEFFVLPSK